MADSGEKDLDMQDLSEFNRGVQHERQRIAKIMLFYDPKTHADDCDCDDCRMFVEWFKVGFPLSWLQGHDLPTGGM